MVQVPWAAAIAESRVGDHRQTSDAAGVWASMSRAPARLYDGGGSGSVAEAHVAAYLAFMQPLY